MIKYYQQTIQKYIIRYESKFLKWILDRLCETWWLPRAKDYQWQKGLKQPRKFSAFLKKLKFSSD